MGHAEKWAIRFVVAFLAVFLGLLVIVYAKVVKWI